MKNIILIVGLIFLIVLFLKVWNSLSRKYNNNIIAKSFCGHCSSVLGFECINDAVKKWEIEKQKIVKESKSGTIILRDLGLICTKCGEINSEKELYKKYKERKLN